MADKILKSITFPGLPDKYLIPQGAPNLQQWATYIIFEDLNNIKENGFYFCDTCDNAPLVDVNYEGFLIVCGSETYANAVAQIYLVLNAEGKTEMYFRIGLSTTDESSFTEWSQAGGASGESGHVVATDPNTKGDITISNANMSTAIAENNEF